MRSDGQSSGGLELRLRLAADTVPLDRVAFAEVEVAAVDGAATVSARLNLIEGDLEVEVTGPDRRVARATWPWPADSAPRSVELAAGERLVAGVPLVSEGSEPLFPVTGRYEVVARFAARPGETLTSNTTVLVRTAGADAALAADLRDRDVVQSLLGAGVIGAAEPALERLAESEDAGTAAAARLALSRTDALQTAADADPAVSRAVAALLPPGATGNDERREAITSRAAPRDVAMLSGRPIEDRTDAAVED
ncbi:hypothetical protein ACFC1I_08320 [Microbacterium sp. NPDC056044]|uniref:hypothetical protein n=1 Tax=Microbacterium sp. NPDC056044 TaxID=3345690 RepID=UPI0035E38B9E